MLRAGGLSAGREWAESDAVILRPGGGKVDARGRMVAPAPAAPRTRIQTRRIARRASRWSSARRSYRRAQHCRRSQPCSQHADWCPAWSPAEGATRLAARTRAAHRRNDRLHPLRRRLRAAGHACQRIRLVCALQLRRWGAWPLLRAAVPGECDAQCGLLCGDRSEQLDGKRGAGVRLRPLFALVVCRESRRHAADRDARRAVAQRSRAAGPRAGATS